LGRAAVAGVCLAGLLATGWPAQAADPARVEPRTTKPAASSAVVGLGTAASFAVLAGTPSVTSTGSTIVTGDLGIDPSPTVAGFPSGSVIGTVHRADRVAQQAKRDLATAYADAAGRSVTAIRGKTLGGLTLPAGVYGAGGLTLDLAGTLTLDGRSDPNAVWIFQSTSDLVAGASSSVLLVNGASACNVFWQVAGSATLGPSTAFAGTILALTSITMDAGVTLVGRAFASNGQVALDGDTITRPGCSTPAPGAPSDGRPLQPAGATGAVGAAAGAATGPLVAATAILLVVLAAVLGEGSRRPRSAAAPHTGVRTRQR
jgi:hypothetical protein